MTHLIALMICFAVFGGLAAVILAALMVTWEII